MRMGHLASGETQQRIESIAASQHYEENVREEKIRNQTIKPLKIFFWRKSITDGLDNIGRGNDCRDAVNV